MPEDKLVLVTGMSGLIGGLAGRRLAERYRVRALNRRPVEGVESFQADITSLEAIKPAFDGVDTVVHLSAYLGPDDASHIGVNVGGTYNVFEAAREAGVRRLIFGSSGAAVAGYERHEPFLAMAQARWDDVPSPRPLVTHESPVWPLRIYGAAKVWGEALGRVYSESHGMSVICLRIGRVTQEDTPVDSRHAAVYCSQRDIVQMIERCVEAPDDVQFDIFYAVSDNRGRFRDIEHARRVVGYEPQDGVKDWPPPGQS